jgi:hypothetical protein
MRILALCLIAFAVAATATTNRTTEAITSDKGPLAKKFYQIISPTWLIGNSTNQCLVHHFCSIGNETSIAECLLYDSNATDAKLIGFEFMVQHDVFAQLPIEERNLWHSHSYEVKNGLVLLPDVTGDQELVAGMKLLANSYGKSFALPMMGKADVEKLLSASATSRNRTQHIAGTNRTEESAVASNRTQQSATTGNRTTSRVSKLDMNKFPFAIPQFYSSFTDKGPQLNQKLIQELDKLAGNKQSDRKNKFSNLQIESKVEGADLWETNTGLQLDIIPLQLQNGNAVEQRQQRVRNQTQEQPKSKISGEEEETSNAGEEEMDDEGVRRPGWNRWNRRWFPRRFYPVRRHGWYGGRWYPE